MGLVIDLRFSVVVLDIFSLKNGVFCKKCENLKRIA
jgi:hypothetical protein